MDINYYPIFRQDEAWKIINDTTTNHLLYGGAAGGGKTHLICAYLIINSLKYPGTRWGLARAHLLTIKKTTMNTLNDMLQSWKLSHLVTFNSMTNIYSFTNGSEIVLLDTFVKPSDSLKDSWGGLELSGCVIDELGETGKLAYDVLYSRIRYKLTEYKLKPFILSASNPCRGWVHSFFLTNPNINTKFLQSLVSDNKYLPSTYIESLSQLDPILKRRLLYGDWNYSQSEDDLFKLDMLEQTFYNEYFDNTNNDDCLTCDPSEGGDKIIVCLWKGFNVVRMEELHMSDGNEIASYIKNMMGLYKVPIKNVVVDSIGNGQATVQNLRGCYEFKGSQSPIGDGVGKFLNLRAQCIWTFSDMISNSKINFNFKYHEDLINQCLLHKKEIRDGKFKVTSKEKIKQQLTHSPDEFDSLYLRMVLTLKKQAGMSWTK